MQHWLNEIFKNQPTLLAIQISTLSSFLPNSLHTRKIKKETAFKSLLLYTSHRHGSIKKQNTSKYQSVNDSKYTRFIFNRSTYIPKYLEYGHRLSHNNHTSTATRGITRKMSTYIPITPNSHIPHTSYQSMMAAHNSVWFKLSIHTPHKPLVS